MDGERVLIAVLVAAEEISGGGCVRYGVVEGVCSCWHALFEGEACSVCCVGAGCWFIGGEVDGGC